MTAYEMRISDWSSDVCSSDLDAADREHEDEAQGPEHRRLEGEAAAPHRRDPAEDLDTGRHRDHHRRGGEIHLGVHVHADGEHVAGPDDEADDADRDHGIGHAEIAEDRSEEHTSELQSLMRN